MINLENKTLILMVTYYFKEKAVRALTSLRQAIEGNDRFLVLVIDNNSQDGLQEELSHFKSSNFVITLLKKNIGKANAINKIVRERFSPQNTPDAVICVDADITFSKDSLLLLDQALRCIPNAGMIAMRYENNGYNPEQRLPGQPTRYLGCDHSIFDIRTPCCANVAGGVFGISRDCFETILKDQFYPVPSDKVYCSDDFLLFQKLRDSGRVNGYLDGTLATHHGEGNYLFSDSPYSRWKLKQLEKGGSITGYFERKRFSLWGLLKR